MIHFKQPKASINLTNLKKELTCAKIANNCPELSFRKIALYLGFGTVSIAPSCWDTGTDIHQGQLYLNGDIYTKYVNNRNDTFVTNCTWIETTRKIIGDIESDEEVIYTYNCFEKDEYFGYFTLFFVFLFPGMCQALKVFNASDSLKTHCHKTIGYGISLALLILSPFFPLQVFLVKLFSFLTNGLEIKKISNVMTLFEATFESNLQFVLQLYIIFTRADRQPSTTQILGLSSSIVFMAKSQLQANFADKPNEPLLKKLYLLPQKLFYIIFWCGSLAIVSSIFRIIFFMVGIVAFSPFAFCLICICIKAKISQGPRWSDQKYKGTLIYPLLTHAALFTTLLVLLVLINHFPDSTIYSIELPLSAILNGSLNLTMVKTKLLDIALVEKKWANYIIPIILISGVMYRVLKYKQNIKPEETIQISNKDNQQDIYEIPRATLQDSPLETKVVKVLVDGKTFIIPTNDLNIEKYPQESQTKIMVKYSNEKDGCFKNLKEKVSCRVKDETPKPIKAYVVKITKDMKKIIVDPDNNIDVQQNTK